MYILYIYDGNFFLYHPSLLHEHDISENIIEEKFSSPCAMPVFPPSSFAFLFILASVSTAGFPGPPVAASYQILF